MLQAVSVSEGGFLGSGGATFFDAGIIDNVAGTISFVFDTLLSAVSGVTGDGLLASIAFHAIAYGSSDVMLFDVLAVNSAVSEIPVDVSSTRVSVPEPGTLLLLFLGAVALIPAMRRRDAGMLALR